MIANINCTSFSVISIYSFIQYSYYFIFFLLMLICYKKLMKLCFVFVLQYFCECLLAIKVKFKNASSHLTYPAISIKPKHYLSSFILYNIICDVICKWIYLTMNRMTSHGISSFYCVHIYIFWLLIIIFAHWSIKCCICSTSRNH